jgi:hypothetical protein
MSKRYIGGLITKSPVTPTTSAAPGIWTLDQATYYIQAGTWPKPPIYIEDYFSTYLYTGNGGTQTITNGINLSANDGMVWIKCRSLAGENNVLLSKTVNSGARYYWLFSDGFGGASSSNSGGTYFNQLSTGFTVGPDSFSQINGNGQTFASWTFRKASRFFDTQTWTGTGSARTIAHSLGVVPGCIIVKRTDTFGDNWQVYHRSNANTQYMELNTTAAVATGTTRWNSTTPTSSVFTVGTDASVNASGGAYVAYLFAHDAASDGIIQCGSLTFPTGTSQVEVNLGWEPQWLLVKSVDTADNWYIFDNMRGMGASNVFKDLRANTSASEADLGNATYPDNITSTGFSLNGGYFGVGTNTKFIYIAIRRGPMKTPTLGTSVFSPVARTGTGANATVTAGFAVDFGISTQRQMASSTRIGPYSKLQGAGQVLNTNATGAEDTRSDSVTGYTNTGIAVGADVGGGYVNASGQPIINWFFQRAPGFMDEVCYTGVNATRTVTHNLGVAPELIIVKNRTTGGTGWPVWASPFSGTNDSMYLNTTAAKSGSGLFTTTPPTSTVFTVANDSWINSSGNNYVAYLFATCPGVSKVGSYTGTGTTQTINCGFTTGARFVLIKRTDSTGDWYVWDSARGIVAGNDPYLLLNSTAAEVTNTDYVDTDNSGFQLSSTAPAALNANGGSYIFLAIS